MKRFKQAVTYIILFLYLFIALFPLYWLITTSLKPPREVFSLAPLGFFSPSLKSYTAVLFHDVYPHHLLNSLLVSGVSVFLTLPVGSLAGYAFVRFKIKHKERWFFTVLTTRMAPPMAFAVPLYLLLVRLGMIDTHAGLIAIYVFMNLAFCIWMSRSFFEEIPQEIEEAAMVDGCSRLRSFWSMTIPLAMNGLLATGVLIFIFTWNEFFFASVITQRAAKPFTVHLTSFFGSRRILWGELAAASSLGSLLPIIFAMGMRRYLIRGLTFGMVKN